jgi:predicted nucleic-acid-binding protein
MESAITEKGQATIPKAIREHLRLDTNVLVRYLTQDDPIQSPKRAGSLRGNGRPQQGLGSFADALIAELGASSACVHTLIFDKKAVRLPGFKLP